MELATDIITDIQPNRYDTLPALPLLPPCSGGNVLLSFAV